MARLLKGRKHFSQSIVVSVAVSNLGKTSLVFVPSGSKVDNVLITVTSFWIRVYYQTLGSCLVITSLFNRMVRQLIVHDKQLRLHAPEFVEPENWPLNSPDLNPVDYSIWGTLKHAAGSLFTVVVAYETLRTWKKSCKPAESKLVKTLSIAL